MYAPIKQRFALIWALALMLLASTAQAALPATTADGKPMPSLAPMLKKVMPAVVNIATETEVRTSENPLMQDPFFRQFFNVPDQPRTQKAIAAGSGVIVNAKKGYVLTNAHVVKHATKISVTLDDGRQLSAKLVGMDKQVDLAVLKLSSAKDLTQIKIGDSSKLRVGDYVVAIGNPFGLGQTATSGIVSALGRTGLGIEGYEDFIQTDASINPGNSGGALVNLNGDLVGINTAILAPSGGNVGIGFAIPTDMAVNVMHQLIKYGEVHRGMLGVTIQNLTPSLAKAFDVKRHRGVVITNVVKGSAAAKAGLKAGDVVTAVDGKAVKRSADLRNKVGLSPVGEKIHLTILRNGEQKEITATISKASSQTSGGGVISDYLKGAKLRNVRQGEMNNVDQGVLVEDVKQNSPAWNAGLRSGDVIINANRKPVKDMAALRAAIKNRKDPLLLRINRNGGIFFVVVR